MPVPDAPSPLRADARVEVLVARLPPDALDWPASDDPSAWCPRLGALAGRRPVDRTRSLAADKMLDALCRRWQVPAHRYEPDGRPSCGQGAHLTASHDGDHVVAGIGERAVGLDVVDCRRRSGWVARIMSADERDVPPPDLTSPDRASSGRFPSDAPSAQARGRAWAVREAALKWAGVGMAVDPRTLTVVSGPDRGERGEGASLAPASQVRLGPGEASRPSPGLWLGQAWWTVRFPDGRAVPVVAGTVGADHVLALAVELPVTVSSSDYQLAP